MVALSIFRARYLYPHVCTSIMNLNFVGGIFPQIILARTWARGLSSSGALSRALDLQVYLIKPISPLSESLWY